MPSHQIVLNLLKENPMRSREETAGIMGKTFAQSRELWTSFPVKAGSGESEQPEQDIGKLFRTAGRPREANMPEWRMNDDPFIQGIHGNSFYKISGDNL